MTPVLEVCQAVGQLVGFWGFSPHLGRVWALLYLSPESLPASSLQEELAISAGALSQHLRELLRWGVVRKVWRPGERKDYYEAETDVWKMVSRVIEEREAKLLGETTDTLERAKSALADGAKRGPKGERELAAFRSERVENLTRLAALARMMVRGLVESQRLDLRSADLDLGEGP